MHTKFKIGKLKGRRIRRICKRKCESYTKLDLYVGRRCVLDSFDIWQGQAFVRMVMNVWFYKRQGVSCLAA